MESSFTPFSEPTNPKEDLLNPAPIKQLVHEENIDLNQYFVEKENKSLENKNKYIVKLPLSCSALISIIIILLASIIPAIVIRKLEIILRLIIILLGIILSLIILLFSKKK